MADQKPTRHPLSQAQLKAPSGDDRRQRTWLLLSALLLLLVPICLCVASQLALFNLSMPKANEGVLSHLAADYATWQPGQFNPLDPQLIGTIRAEQATFAANPPGLGTLVPFLPLPGTLIAGLPASVTPTPTPSPTPSPTVVAPTATQFIIFPGATNTPAPVPATITLPPTNTAAPPPPTPLPLADLAITKDDGVTTVNPGASVPYIIVVRNNGPSAVANALVQDTFPAQIVPASITWTCAPSPGSTCNMPSGMGNINATVNLLVGGTATFTVSATTISPPTSGTIVNTATVTPPPNRVDPIPANNTATDTDTVPTADLIVSIVDNPDPVVSGHSFTYTVTITNNGPSTATGVVVTNDFNTGIAGVTVTSASAPGGSCAPPPPPALLITAPQVTVTCNFPLITSGGSQTITFTVSTTNPSSGTVNLTSTAIANEFDPSLAFAFDSTTVGPLVVTLTWNGSGSGTAADFDLWVVEPSGANPVINSPNNTATPHPSSSGGWLLPPPPGNGDTNCTDLAGPPQSYVGSETAGWPAPGLPPSGTYHAYISYYQACAAVPAPGVVSWTLTATVNGITVATASGSGTYNPAIAPAGPAPGCPGPFLLPGVNLSANATCPPVPYNPLTDAAIGAANAVLTFTIP